MIDSFTGRYAFLSNFYGPSLVYDGIKYLNSEAAFQAQKTTDESVRREFSWLSPDEAKRKGRSLNLRPDWEQVKYDVMHDICFCKFAQNPEYAQWLIDTGDEELIEGNTWGDKCWGVCNGVGENHLGKILMRVREELKSIMGQPVYIVFGGDWQEIVGVKGVFTDEATAEMVAQSYKDSDDSFVHKCYLNHGLKKDGGLDERAWNIKNT